MRRAQMSSSGDDSDSDDDSDSSSISEVDAFASLDARAANTTAAPALVLANMAASRRHNAVYGEPPDPGWGRPVGSYSWAQAPGAVASGGLLI